MTVDAGGSSPGPQPLPVSATVLLLLATIGVVLGCVTVGDGLDITDASGIDADPLTHRLASPAEIELGFAGVDNRLPYVTAEIDGHSFLLMLDTGHFEAISLTPHALEMIDADYSPESTTYSDLSGQTYSARRFAVPDLVLGEVHFTDVPGVENLFGPEEFDGTIGEGLLDGYRVTISHAARIVTLGPTGGPPPGGCWTQIELRRGMRIPVGVVYGGANAAIGIDTGHSSMMVPRRSRLARIVRRESSVPASHVTTNERTGDRVEIYRLEHLYAGDYDLGPQTCVVADEARYMGNGMLGFGFFRSNDVIIDFPRGAIWVRPAAR
jgi:hypothetical protein